MPRTAALSACLALSAPFLSASSAAGDDWPQFRGPRLDSISQETGWSPGALKEPKILWKQEIGIGYSGPAVVGDAVYIMGFSDGQEHVRRLDAKTGEVVWTHSYPGAKIDNLNAGGPGATPTVDGEFVYTYGREGQFRCLKAADGEVVWSKQPAADFGADLPPWGYTTSPLIVGDRVIVDAGRLAAFDKRTGEAVWQSAPRAAGYGTPTPFELKGEAYLAHIGNDGLTVARLSDGEEVAFYEVEAQFDTAAASPIVVGDTIWFSIGYDGKCQLVRFTGSAIEPVYESKKLKSHFGECILIGKHVYGISGQTNNSRTCLLVCMEYATGKVAWQQRGGGFGSLVAADGNLIYLNDEGTAAVVPASSEKFSVTSTGDVLDGQCWTHPVLANGHLYCRNSEGTLVAVDMTK